MEIAFRARNVEVPENLRRVTRERVTRLGRRCGIDRADVCFSERRNPRIREREVCRITLFGAGHILAAQAAAAEVAVAVDRVVGQLEQRAERFRGRVTGRRNRRGCARGGSLGGPLGGRPAGPALLAARPTGAISVHFPPGWSTGAIIPGAVDPITGDAGEAADMGISQSRTEPMTPEEAAVHMGRRGREIFVFDNAETGRPAVVYRRPDGDIALSEAHPTIDARS